MSVQLRETRSNAGLNQIHLTMDNKALIKKLNKTLLECSHLTGQLIDQRENLMEDTHPELVNIARQLASCGESMHHVFKSEGMKVN